MREGGEGLDRVRRLCMALPGAWEKVAWGEPTWRAGKRVFAMFAADHHGDGRVAVWCPAPVGVQEALVHHDAAKFFVPPYVGPGGWIGVMVERCGDGELAQLLEQAYCIVAPKKLQAQLASTRHEG